MPIIHCADTGIAVSASIHEQVRFGGHEQGMAHLFTFADLQRWVHEPDFMPQPICGVGFVARPMWMGLSNFDSLNPTCQQCLEQYQRDMQS